MQKQPPGEQLSFLLGAKMLAVVMCIETMLAPDYCKQLQGTGKFWNVYSKPLFFRNIVFIHILKAQRGEINLLCSTENRVQFDFVFLYQLWFTTVSTPRVSCSHVVCSDQTTDHHLQPNRPINVRKKSYCPGKHLSFSFSLFFLFFFSSADRVSLQWK